MSRADFPETAKTNFDEFKGKDCVFVAEWLKTKGLHKLCFAFEGVSRRFTFNYLSKDGSWHVRVSEKLKQ